MKNKYVDKIYYDHLCCSCGFCIGICPKNSISFGIDKLGFFKPTIDYNTCIDCGQCVRLCSGKKDLKNKNHVEEYYCYGYSTDEETRIHSSSGGIATELLCYMLDNHIVDYVTTISNRTRNSYPKVILTNDTSVVRENKTSKYCPVPFGEIISSIKEVKGTIAVLGLPCQINSLKKWRCSNIKYYFSLLCNHTPSYYATDFLAKNLHFENWDSIKYRGNGWPGNMIFSSRDKQIQKSVEFRNAWATGFGRYFKNRRCFICNDPFSKNADIVFGDAYFLEKEEKGSTFCIVRNNDLKEFLYKMHDTDIIKMTEGPEVNILQKYFKVLYDRENDYVEKLTMFKKLHYPIPEYKDLKEVKISIKETLKLKISIITITLGKYSFLWRFLFVKNRGLKLKIK
jgi:coenzyme F420 hydrogenase subunit beta